MNENNQQPEKKQGQKDSIGVLSYIGILFLVPLLARKDDAFAQFHAKQGLALFICEVATSLVAWIPFLGWIVGLAGWIMWLILSITGIMNVVKGKQVPLPVIGKLGEKFKF